MLIPSLFSRDIIKGSEKKKRKGFVKGLGEKERATKKTRHKTDLEQDKGSRGRSLLFSSLVIIDFGCESKGECEYNPLFFVCKFLEEKKLTTDQVNL